MDETIDPHFRLQRRLGLPFAIAIAAGTVIGSGIMRTPGVIANEVPSVWIALLLWLLGGIYVLLSANVSAELTAALPRAGGTYVPVHEAYGNGLGLLAGWAMWLGYVGGAAALALACTDFLGTIVPAVAAHNITLAIAVLMALTGLNWLGVEEGRITQIVGTALKVGLLVCVIVAAILLDPVVAAPSGDPAPGISTNTIGLVALVTGFQIVLGAYDGWQGPIFFAEEDKDPGRNIPRALFRSAFVIIAVYLALNLSLFAVLDMETLRTSELPVALVIEALFGPMGKLFVALLATLMALITLNGVIMTAPRILYSMARDGLFPHAAMRVNRGGTPWVAMILASIVATPLIMTGAYVFVFKIQTALGVLAACLYNASYFTLRRQRPDLERPFRAIGHPVLPALILAISIALFAAVILADPAGGIWIMGLVAIALPVGVMLGHHRRVAVPE